MERKFGHQTIIIKIEYQSATYTINDKKVTLFGRRISKSPGPNQLLVSNIFQTKLSVWQLPIKPPT